MGPCPHKSPSPCNTYVIPMLLYKCPHLSQKRVRAHTHKYLFLKVYIHLAYTSIGENFSNFLKSSKTLK